jgi:protein-tyrosine phosphatase
MITFITPKLAIGDANDARNATPNQFEATLNVALDLDIEDDEPNTDVVCFRIKRNKVGLVDGPGNDPLTVVSAVILLHSLIKSNRKVLIHCQAGQSRSVMIAAAYCHVSGVAQFDLALKQILELRKVDKYRNELYTLVRSVLSSISSLIEHSNKNKELEISTSNLNPELEYGIFS